MSLFVMADTHFSTTLNKPMDIFGARWQDSARKICDSWNAVVTENDTVIVPGDISWGMTLDEAREDLLLLDSLPGQKIISRGNHDYWWASAKKNEEFFARNQIRTIRMLHNNAFLCEGKLICGSRGWFNDEKAAPEHTDYEKLTSREAGRIQLSIDAGRALWEKEGTGGDCPEILLFLHFPPIFRSYRCEKIVEVLKQNGIRRCFFGHIHGVYDFPSSFEEDGVTYSLISADFLHFIPLLIR